MQLCRRQCSNQQHADISHLPGLPLAQVDLLNIERLRIRVQPDFHNLSHPASQRRVRLCCLLRRSPQWPLLTSCQFIKCQKLWPSGANAYSTNLNKSRLSFCKTPHTGLKHANEGVRVP